ncbi:MAG: hypothetical protein WC699_08090 [Bacteroidales bacterium]|jgi:hypothetical protein
MNKTIITLLAICLWLIGCKKEEPLIPLCNPGNYFPLETGNYWVFRNFRINDSGIVEERENDSMYISSDTLMLGFRYYHLQGSFSDHPINSFLTRDNNQIRSSKGYVFYECPRIFDSKKLYPLIDFDYPGTISTRRIDSLLTVPAGDFDPVMLFEAHSMFQDTVWIVTYKCYYAKNVGMVKFIARCVGCEFENNSELIRYHVNK